MSVGKNPPAILPYSPENYPPTIPDFASEEEARDFFDTHDMTYYDDQFEELAYEDWPEPFKRLAERGRARGSGLDPKWPTMPKVSVTLTFSNDMVAALSTLAAKREIPVDVLLQWWIFDRLEQEQAEPDATANKAPDSPPSEARRSA